VPFVQYFNSKELIKSFNKSVFVVVVDTPAFTLPKSAAVCRKLVREPRGKNNNNNNNNDDDNGSPCP
jgi:hypothetical protein